MALVKKDKDENGDGGKTENVDPNVLIAQLLAQMVANQPMRQITEDSPEYNLRNRAEGFYDAFPKPVYQNAKVSEARGLSEQTRERAATMKPGTYMVGKVKVDVEVSHDGGRHYKYKSRSVEDRMAYAGAWTDFSDLIDKLYAQTVVMA